MKTMNASLMRMKFRNPSGFTIAPIFLDIIIGTFAIPSALPGHGNRKASRNRSGSILLLYELLEHQVPPHCTAWLAFLIQYSVAKFWSLGLKPSQLKNFSFKPIITMLSPNSKRFLCQPGFLEVRLRHLRVCLILNSPANAFQKGFNRITVRVNLIVLGCGAAVHRRLRT